MTHLDQSPTQDAIQDIAEESISPEAITNCNTLQELSDLLDAQRETLITDRNGNQKTLESAVPLGQTYQQVLKQTFDLLVKSRRRDEVLLDRKKVSASLARNPEDLSGLRRISSCGALKLRSHLLTLLIKVANEERQRREESHDKVLQEDDVFAHNVDDFILQLMDKGDQIIMTSALPKTLSEVAYDITQIKGKLKYEAQQIVQEDPPTIPEDGTYPQEYLERKATCPAMKDLTKHMPTKTDDHFVLIRSNLRKAAIREAVSEYKVQNQTQSWKARVKNALHL